MNKKHNTTKKFKKATDKVVILRKKPKPKSEEVAKPKRLNQYKFGLKVLADMNRILPKPPYSIGINKELFEALKENYPDERMRLRKTIKHFLRYKTQGEHYLRAMLTKEFRNGMNNNQYPILKKHREFAKLLLIEKQRSNDGSKKKNKSNDSSNRKR